jgi:hypothetical protein
VHAAATAAAATGRELLPDIATGCASSVQREIFPEPVEEDAGENTWGQLASDASTGLRCGLHRDGH